MVSSFVEKMHPKLSSTVRIDINASIEDIALVVDYLRYSHDIFWVEHWRANFKSESLIPVLAIAVALQIPTLCRLLYPDTYDATSIDSRTIDQFFATV